tara:strand:+ start:7878 stop:8783 length:906 start_codon:yes stop_codon:yes gene_type:complete
MTDIKLFSTANGVAEIDGSAVGLERALQSLFERNLEVFLGVRFLASEYATSNGGRMDTLGIDENGCPVIIEYKRDKNDNVINQGLFYLDWLMDHRAAFELLVRDTLGKDQAARIEWAAPRLICIAGDFNKFDEHAVKQMSRNIELVRYRKYGEELLLLELLTAVSVDTATAFKRPIAAAGTGNYKTVSQYLADADENLTNLYDDLRGFMVGLGDDVQEKTLRYYIAFRRIKNFACVEIQPRGGIIKLFLKVDPDRVVIEPGFTRDVRTVGHYGTGDLEISISNQGDLEKAKPLITQSYENS